MKISIFLLLIKAVIIQFIFCDDSLLSKFHQNAFKIRDIRGELLSYNEKYVNHADLKSFKYNRTTTAFNITFNVKDTNIKNKVEILVQCYKFLSNEYRHFPIRFQVNLIKLIHSNVIGIKAIRNCGNITSTNVEKNITYRACNFVVDETHFPPLIPSGRYKIEITFSYLDEELAFVYGFGEIYTPIDYPKN